MKPLKYKSYSVFGTAVILIIIAGMFLGGAWLYGSTRTVSSSNLTQREVPVMGNHSLALDYPDGDVKISAGSGDTILLNEYTAFGPSGVDKLKVNADNGITSIVVSKTNGFPFNFFNFANKRRLEVIVPQTLLDDLSSLQITTISGNIELPTVKTGQLKIESTSGNVSKGRIIAINGDVSTISGSISDLEIQADTLALRSTSGSISDMKLSGGRLVVETMSGSLDDLEIDSADLKLYSTSGTIKADVKSPSSRISTISGNIKLRLFAGITLGEFQSISGSVDLTIPDDTVEIEYSTTSGNIEINTRQVRDKGRIMVSTNSGSIDINP